MKRRIHEQADFDLEAYAEQVAQAFYRLAEHEVIENEHGYFSLVPSTEVDCESSSYGERCLFVAFLQFQPYSDEYPDLELESIDMEGPSGYVLQVGPVSGGTVDVYVIADQSTITSEDSLELEYLPTPDEVAQSMFEDIASDVEPFDMSEETQQAIDDALANQDAYEMDREKDRRKYGERRTPKRRRSVREEVWDDEDEEGSRDPELWLDTVWDTARAYIDEDIEMDGYTLTAYATPESLAYGTQVVVINAYPWLEPAEGEDYPEAESFDEHFAISSEVTDTEVVVWAGLANVGIMGAEEYRYPLDDLPSPYELGEKIGLQINDEIKGYFSGMTPEDFGIGESKTMKRRQVNEIGYTGKTWWRNDWAPGPWDEEGNVYDEEEGLRDLTDEEARQWAEAHDLPIDEPTTGGWELMSFAWPGGYPVVYYDYQGEAMHPDTAMEEIFHVDAERRPVYADIYYEGPTIIDFNDREIESAYGDPDEEDFEERKTPIADKMIAREAKRTRRGSVREQEGEMDNERPVGFEIALTDEGVIGDNAYERFSPEYGDDEDRQMALDAGFIDEEGQITDAGWAQLAADYKTMEDNLVAWLKNKFGSVSPEGHGSNDSLLGTLWLDTTNRDQVEIVITGMEERVSSYNLSYDVYQGMSDFGASVIDGDIYFFGTNWGDNDLTQEELEEIHDRQWGTDFEPWPA